MDIGPLATLADLAEREITPDDEYDLGLADFLDAASAEVRSAAGVPISRASVTVTLPGRCEPWLPLPCQPVVSVAEVRLDAEPLAAGEWKLVGGRLWRRYGWQANPREPSEVTVALTGGIDPVPADIVDLVCAMVGAAQQRLAEQGYATRGDLVGVRVDDYSEQYQSSAQDRLAGVMELPTRTRDRLRARFGGAAAVVRTGA